MLTKVIIVRVCVVIVAWWALSITNLLLRRLCGSMRRREPSERSAVNAVRVPNDGGREEEVDDDAAPPAPLLADSDSTSAMVVVTGKRPPTDGREYVWMPKFEIWGFESFGIQKAGAIFALYALRIMIVPLWSSIPYIPIVSPLYRQGEHWIATQPRTLAIILHVLSGSTALLCGGRQLNRELRHRNKPLHRLVSLWICWFYTITEYSTNLMMIIIIFSSGAST